MTVDSKDENSHAFCLDFLQEFGLRALVEGPLVNYMYIFIKGLKIPPLLRKYEYEHTLAPNTGGSKFCKIMHWSPVCS
jgi:hypothetical protein